MGHNSDRAMPNWTFWLWVAAAAIPLGLGVTWIVRNFSPIAPDALAIPAACVVVLVTAVAVSSRRSERRLSDSARSTPVESGHE